MPQFYQVPPEQSTGPVFTVTMNGVNLAFDKNFYENSMTFLLPLAHWLEIDVKAYRDKTGLCNSILSRLTWTSEEEALTRWPDLVSLKETANEKKALQVALAGTNRLLGDILEETPEFYAHANRAVQDLRAKLTAISEEERRVAEEAIAPPAWWNYWQKTSSGQCWKVVLEIDEMDHDGYCSGTEEDDKYVAKTRVETVFVPLKDDNGMEHDFTKKSWKGDPCCSGGCGCCGTVETIRLKSVEQVQ